MRRSLRTASCPVRLARSGLASRKLSHGCGRAIGWWSSRSIVSAGRSVGRRGDRDGRRPHPARGVTVVALREAVDTSTATRRAVAAVMASLAELELELGKERRAASRSARGLPATRPPRLDPAQQVYRGGEPIAEVCSMFGVSRATAFRYIKAAAVAA
jgi:hypothetical protein